jgi:hypothetical protein
VFDAGYNKVDEDGEFVEEEGMNGEGMQQVKES